MILIRRIIGLGVVVAAMFAAGPTIGAVAKPGAKQKLIQSVRTSDDELRHVIELALSRSWTLRELDARLSRSPVIVYLARVSLSRGLAGRTRLIGAGEGWRFLSVELDRRLNSLDLMTVLGHELQHALEIAGESSVVDDGSLAELYRRIGTPSMDSEPDLNAFETQLAIDTGRRVHMELIGLI